MKIKYKLYFSFAAIAFVLLISSFAGIIIFKSINNDIQTAQQINTPNTLYALEMRTAVFQVQQWFTDASLTKDKTVIAEAEMWREVYFENSVLLRKNLELTDDNDKIILLDATDKDFDAFYELGTRMTYAYIDEGFESGNILMESFDSSAEILGEDIEKIKEDQINGLSLILDNLISKGKKLNITLIALLLFGLMITSLTMIYLVKKITKPLKDLEHASKAIAEGDLTVEINEDTKASKDEIGTLAASFSIMAINLKRMIKTISENTNNTAAIAEGLSASAQEVNASSEQVSGTIQEIAKGAQNLAASTTNSKLETDRLIESINNVARAAESSSVQAMETEKTARIGGESAEKAGKVMNQILESTKSASKNISELQEESKEIVKIIDVINTISEQTNLLALNAAIEAARAGDAGRGFAVVADEVRKLAEESQKATKQIEEMVANIQNKTKSSVEQMNQSTLVVNEGSKVISETLKSLNTIVDKVTDVASGIEAINSVSKMQLEISGKVQKSITEVSAVAEESAAGTEEVSASVEETTSSMQQIATSSQNLAKSADELKLIINKFKI